MDLFEQSFRPTLDNYITQVRIAHAQRLLATTTDKILEVAPNSGFRTPSRFHEAFEQTCRATPTVYRKARGRSAITPAFQLDVMPHPEIGSPTY